MPDDPLVHGVVLGVGTRAVDRPGVVDLVPDLEQLDLGAHRDHRAGGVPAEHLPVALRIDVLAHLVVDRVQRHRLHPDQQVPRTGLGNRQLHVLQAVRVLDGQARAVGHGTHRRGDLVLAHHGVLRCGVSSWVRPPVRAGAAQVRLVHLAGARSRGRHLDGTQRVVVTRKGY